MVKEKIKKNQKKIFEKNIFNWKRKNNKIQEVRSLSVYVELKEMLVQLSF